MIRLVQIPVRGKQQQTAAGMSSNGSFQVDPRAKKNSTQEIRSVVPCPHANGVAHTGQTDISLVLSPLLANEVCFLTIVHLRGYRHAAACTTLHLNGLRTGRSRRGFGFDSHACGDVQI